jgi:hypothetical protein
MFVEKSSMLPKPYTVERLLAGLSILGVTHPHRDPNT